MATSQLNDLNNPPGQPRKLSFLAGSRPWTVEDFKGIPSERELEELSQVIVSTLKSINKTTFKTAQGASALRAYLGTSLGVPLKKILSTQALNWLEQGDDVEVKRFCKIFEIWKANEDQPVRILLVGALMGSSNHSIIPKSLQASFHAAHKIMAERTTRAEKIKAKVQGYGSLLENGTIPMVSVPVCLIGFCEAGKSSLCRLLTGAKHSPMTNSTKVASSFSITPRHTKYSVLWKSRNRESNARTLAAAIAFADQLKDKSSTVIGRQPSHLLESSLVNLSLSSSVTASSKKLKTRQAELPIKQIPADVAELFDSPQSICINFNANPEVILQILDCGGQPMYLETIPLLVGPRCIYCIVYNLMWKLDDPAEIKYWLNGNLVQQKTSCKTYLEHVIEWITIIDCQFCKDLGTRDQPTALFIGTHFDLFMQERFNNDRMEAYIAAVSIFERVKAAVQDKLCSCKLHIKAYYVNSATAGTATEDVNAAALRTMIEETARDYSTIAMPISWLCLLHQLQYYSKESKPFVHITEVKEKAAVSGIKREELSVCLQMLHRLSMLFYFHNVEELQGYVFTDTNWFLQELGKIFTVPSVTLYANEWRHLKRTGLVTNRLQSYLFEGEFIKGWSLRILSFLGLAGAIENDSKTAVIPRIFFASDHGNRSYSLPFFPSMIEEVAHSPPRREHLTFPNGESLSPIFLVFSTNELAQYGLLQYTPPGFLTHLISKLTESCFLSIVLDARDNPSVSSFSNQFTFTCGKFKLDHITIRGHKDCIQITVERNSRENRPEFTPPSEVCALAYEEINETSKSILQQWIPRLTIQPCFFCRNCEEAYHFAVLHEVTLSPPMLCCTRNSMLFSAIQPEALWFKQPKVSN